MSEQIILLACYELGRQPLSLAWPLAVLRQEGIATRGVDLHVQNFPTQEITDAKFVGIATPMHTALRLGIRAAQQVRELNPNAHICFYGMYAWLNREYLLESYADSIIGGEYEEALVGLAKAVETGTSLENLPGVTTFTSDASPVLARLKLPTPKRTSLPPLEDYAHYTQNGKHYTAGYVEASRGCLHTCKHCPVVPVYEGRFFIIPFETVMADIRQQVRGGASHITFGDPDFLNGPKHALKIARALHQEFPEVTFDFTAKVEHILENEEYMGEFAQLGCSFMVTAFEAIHDHILVKLDKGHTAADMEKSLNILRKAGISPQPTWMPFTPWTSLEDYTGLLGWIKDNGLISHVPAVQMAVRMLLPPGSKLAEQEAGAAWLGELDHANLSYEWKHPDPRMDELHQTISRIAEEYAERDAFETFKVLEQAVYDIAGRQAPLWSAPIPLPPSPPKLTEHWFC